MPSTGKQQLRVLLMKRRELLERVAATPSIITPLSPTKKRRRGSGTKRKSRLLLSDYTDSVSGKSLLSPRAAKRPCGLPPVDTAPPSMPPQPVQEGALNQHQLREFTSVPLVADSGDGKCIDFSLSPQTAALATPPPCIPEEHVCFDPNPSKRSARKSSVYAHCHQQQKGLNHIGPQDTPAMHKGKSDRLFLHFHNTPVRQQRADGVADRDFAMGEAAQAILQIHRQALNNIHAIRVVQQTCSGAASFGRQLASSTGHKLSSILYS